MADKFIIENGYEAIISDAAKAIIGGGDVPTLTATTVTPSTSATTITAPTGTAYNEINVEAVTASIDANIAPENIKTGVTILGVTGTYTA